MRSRRFVVVAAALALSTTCAAWGQEAPLRLRVMAANTSSGNLQSYPLPGPGTRIFRALLPDVVLVQEFNVHATRNAPNDDDAVDDWVDSIEPALAELAAVVDVLGPFPDDGTGNGATNRRRRKPYDWVLADGDLQAFSTTTEIGELVFDNGLVFDSRLFSLDDLEESFPPVERGDSEAPQMQHMAVVRDFEIDRSSPADPPVEDDSSEDDGDGSASGLAALDLGGYRLEQQGGPAELLVPAGTLPAGGTRRGRTYRRVSTSGLDFVSFDDPLRDASPGRFEGARAGDGRLVVTEIADAPGDGNFIFEFVELLWDASEAPD